MASPSKLIESLRGDLGELRKAGAISQATMRRFDRLAASGHDERVAGVPRRRNSAGPRPKRRR